MRNPRVVVDTNVWISALLNKTGAPARILDLFVSGKIDVVVSAQLLDELAIKLSHDKFVRKYGITPAIRDEFVRLIETGADVVEPQGRSYGCRDQDDDVVIETALLGAADVAVSGDSDLVDDPAIRHLLQAHGIELLVPRRFLDAIESKP